MYTDLSDKCKSEEIRDSAIDRNEYLLFGAQNLKHVSADGDERFNTDELQ